MLPSRIWKTTTFRLSAIYGAVFVAGIVLLLGLVYYQTASYLTLRVDQSLAAEAANLRRAGPEGILKRLARDAVIDPLNSFGLFTGTGEKVAGGTSLTPADLRPDGRPRDASVGVEGRQTPSRALAERMPWGEILIVERDTRQLAELRRIVFNALIWSGALTVIFGLGSGLLFSIRPLGRIRAMQAASEAITAGEFSQRLPTDDSRDELDELARITNQMMDEAERLMLQARTAGEGVAHELRTPLTRLRARLDHACDGLAVDDPRRPLLDQCVTEIDGMLTRFRALLRIAALDARGRRTGIAAIALDPTLESIADLYGPLAAELNVDLEVRLPAEAISLQADGELLMEAVSNVVDNALKFTPAGGRVVVSAFVSPTGPVIEVVDSGPGIPEAERALVTRRFYRGPRGAHAPGHGLGLSLVAAIMDLHRFELSFDDARPGAIVRLSLTGVGPGSDQRPLR